MVKLNLPDFDYKLKKAEGKVWIFDVIRKKYIVLTPEEWVRQHFVNFLINYKKFPKALIKIEGGLTYNELQKRSDIVVFDREARPWLVIECKSPNNVVSAATLQQVSMYNSTLKAPYVAVTNGLVLYCASIDWRTGAIAVLDDLPIYS